VLNGSVLLVGSNGSKKDLSSGIVSLEIRVPGRVVPGEAPVSDGTWHLNLPIGATSVLVRQVSSDTPTSCWEPVGETPIPPDHRLDILAYSSSEAWLRVVDAETGDELKDIRLLSARWPRWMRAEHPHGLESSRLLYDGSPSPVVLPYFRRPDCDRHGEAVILATAPGYAWSRLDVFGDQRGERKISLQRGGALHVTLTGTYVPDRRLRVRQKGEGSPRLVCDIGLDDDSEVLIEKLPAGMIEVTVEVGGWSDEPEVVARGSVEIRPSQMAGLTLEATPAPQQEFLERRLTIELDRGWESLVHGIVLALSYEGDCQGLPRSASSTVLEVDEETGLSFSKRETLLLLSSTRALLIGEWSYSVRPCGVTGRFLVASGDSSEILIPIPQPGRVSLKVLKGDSDEEVPLQSIQFLTEHGDSAETVMAGSGEQSGFSFLAPLGAVRVSGMSEGPNGPLLYGETQVELEEPQAATTLHLREIGILCIRLLDGKQVAPWRRVWSRAFEVNHLEDRGRILDERYHLGVLTVATTPGRVRVHLPAIPGFLAPRPEEVVLEPGQVRTLDIHLRSR